MTSAETLLWTERFLALALLQQSFEQIRLNQCFIGDGGWRWETLKKDFKGSDSFTDWIYSKLIPSHFFAISRIIAIFAFLLCPHFLIFLFLFLTHLLLLSRWRGNFNGASDQMTVILLGAVTLAELFPETAVIRGALYYIGLQSVFSYFIGGWIKVKKSNWRQGKALPVFIALSSSKNPKLVTQLLAQSRVSKVLSWLVMAFELSSPLCLFIPSYLPWFIGLAFCFHLANFYLLGLNRFVFVWLATYPALIFTAQIVSLL